MSIPEKKLERIRAEDNNTTPGINQIKGAIESTNSVPKSKFINQSPKIYNNTPPKQEINSTFLETIAVKFARSKSELKFDTLANKTVETDWETTQIRSTMVTATVYKPTAASFKK
mgnify:CR=1 FL=1